MVKRHIADRLCSFFNNKYLNNNKPILTPKTKSPILSRVYNDWLILEGMLTTNCMVFPVIKLEKVWKK